MKFPKNNRLVSLFIFFAWLAPAFGQGLSENDQRTLRMTAEAFERAGQYQQAANFYARLALANPKDVAAYLGAKRAYDSLQDYEKFAAFILALQQKHRDVRYSIDLAWIKHKQGETAAAKKDWENILAENANNLQAYSLIGLVYVENQMYEDAVDVYLAARKALRNNTAFVFDLANLYRLLDKPEKVLEEYIAYLAENPQQVDFLAAEIQRYAQEQRKTDLLIRELQKNLKSRPAIAWAIHLLLADLYLVNKDYANGLAFTIELEKDLQNAETARQIRAYQRGKFLYDFANNALADNAVNLAEQALQTILTEMANSPYAAKAKLGLAQVYLKQADYQKAIESLQLFVQSNNKSNEVRQALLQIGDIAFNQLFDLELAEQAYAQALREYPNVGLQIETLFRLADCALARDDLAAAEQYLTSAQNKAAPEPHLLAEAFFKQAQLAFYRQQPKKSLDYLTQFSETSVPNSQPNVLENDALELTILLQENGHDSTGLAVLGKARLLYVQRKFFQAGELLKTHLAVNPNSLLRSELRMTLVEIHRQLGEYEPAVALLDSIYADQDSFFRDAALMVLAAVYAKNLHNPLLAQQQYEKILMEFPNSIYLEQARDQVRTLEENLLP